jgi:ATP-dependent RNA helicase DDX54/DBP10
MPDKPDKKKKKGGGFENYNLDLPLFKAVKARGYNLPTPI